MTFIPANERDLLQALATRVREIAVSDLNRQRRQRAFALNDLSLERPFVLCLPENAWRELVPQESLRCSHPEPRRFEWDLRARIFQHDAIGDDAVIEDILDVPTVADISGWGVDIPQHRVADHGAATWDPPLADISRDLPRLHQRTLTVDRAATAQRLALAEDLFDGILMVRESFGGMWSVGLTASAIKLIGLEQFLFAMYDDPQGLHRLMAWLRDDCAHLMDQCEAAGLLDSMAGANPVGSGGIGYTTALPSRDPRDPSYRRPVTYRQRWGLGESQETVGVSPEMFAEFVLPYQRPLLERLGLVCYGCCEGLETRIDHILDLPRLRRVSVSPWADQAIMAEKLGRKAIFSRKPNPALVCVDFNEAAVRRDLRSTLAVADGCVLEFVLKDTHTVQHQTDRFARWVAIAREEIDRHYAD